MEERLRSQELILHTLGLRCIGDTSGDVRGPSSEWMDPDLDRGKGKHSQEGMRSRVDSVCKEGRRQPGPEP